MAESTVTLTERLDAAFKVAREVHEGQVRKGTDIPYLSHLLGVASLILTHGGTEDEAIAALLHDAVEDGGGLPRLEQIREQFGEEIAAIVDECSDTYEEPKPEWWERKKKYIAGVAGASRSAQLVSACDKLHNVMSLVADLRNEGPTTMERFKKGAEGTLWYYETLLGEYEKGELPASLMAELRHYVEEMKRLAAS